MYTMLGSVTERVLILLEYSYFSTFIVLIMYIMLGSVAERVWSLLEYSYFSTAIL